MRKLLIYAAALTSLGTGGCAIYKLDVPQGNVIEQADVEKLRPGLTRRQVEFLLGTPLVTDVFHPDRWDYIYFFKPGRGEPERRLITLYFEGDRLVRMTGDLAPPPGQAPAGETPVPVPQGTAPPAGPPEPLPGRLPPLD